MLSRPEDTPQEFTLTGIIGRLFLEEEIIAKLENKDYRSGILIMITLKAFLISKHLEDGLTLILSNIREILLFAD
jgi:hypothetical protein